MSSSVRDRLTYVIYAQSTETIARLRQSPSVATRQSHEKEVYSFRLTLLYVITNTPSLHLLKRESIDGLLDYMDLCHPGLKETLRNVSYVLPRLLTWGIPKIGLQILNVPFDDLLHLKDDPFNNVFPVPASVVNEVPDLLQDVPSWSLDVDEGEENEPKVLEDGCSNGRAVATCTTPNSQDLGHISFDFE